MTVQRSGPNTSIRRVVFALVIFLVCTSAGVQVHASTECEHWMAEYRAILAHSDTVKRANAARHRLHRYIHRKINGLTKPKTARKSRVLPARHRQPQMSREEVLRKLEFACEVPVETPALGNLPNEPMPVFIAESKKSDEELPLDTYTPSTLLALNQASSYAGGGLPIDGYGPGFYVPGFGGLGWGGGGTNAKTPTTTGTGGENPPPSSLSVPTAEAPEPGSLLLMGTGLVVVTGMIHRRQARKRGMHGSAGVSAEP